MLEHELQTSARRPPGVRANLNSLLRESDARSNSRFVPDWPATRARVPQEASVQFRSCSCPRSGHGE